jgi:hypothetical protein
MTFLYELGELKLLCWEKTIRNKKSIEKKTTRKISESKENVGGNEQR